jgi:hypothetical protein
VVAATGPTRAVRSVDQRVELGFGEKGNERAFVALRPDLQDALDRRTARKREVVSFDGRVNGQDPQAFRDRLRGKPAYEGDADDGYEPKLAAAAGRVRRSIPIEWWQAFALVAVMRRRGRVEAQQQIP